MKVLAKNIFKGRGFSDFNIDIMIKIGGSLFKQDSISQYINILKSIEKISSIHNIVVMSGGGIIDKTIEKIAKQHELDVPSICPACIRALDQMGYLICALDKKFIPFKDFEELRNVPKGFIPTFIPSKLSFAIDAFVRTNIITSDTIAAYFAFLLGADKFVILTDVDGIYSDPNKHILINHISAKALIKYGNTSVDACLSEFLDTVSMDCYISNGDHPNYWMDLDNFQGTIINSK